MLTELGGNVLIFLVIVVLSSLLVEFLLCQKKHSPWAKKIVEIMAVKETCGGSIIAASSLPVLISGATASGLMILAFGVFSVEFMDFLGWLEGKIYKERGEYAD